MREVDVDGHHYRIDKLPAMQQWHIARRLAPCLTAMAEGMNGHAVSLEDLRTEKVPLGEMLLALEPIAKALGHMSDEDSEYILKTALGVCQRQDGASWQRVIEPRTKMLLYEDIQLPSMLQLTYESLMESLGSFFGTRQSNSPPQVPST